MTKKAQGLALLVFLVFMWAVGLDAILYPWAFAWMRPITGAPTLVGTWYGELTTPTGRTQWVALDLDLLFSRNCRSACSRIQAAARVCDGRGERRFAGQTRPDNWRGTRLALEVTGATSDSYQIIRMRMQREAEVLRTLVELESTRRTSTGAAVGSAREDGNGNIVRTDVGADTLFPTKILLRRGNESDFEQICRRLAGR